MELLYRFAFNPLTLVLDELSSSLFQFSSAEQFGASVLLLTRSTATEDCFDLQFTKGIHACFISEVGFLLYQHFDNYFMSRVF